MCLWKTCWRSDPFYIVTSVTAVTVVICFFSCSSHNAIYRYKPFVRFVHVLYDIGTWWYPNRLQSFSGLIQPGISLLTECRRQIYMTVCTMSTANLQWSRTFHASSAETGNDYFGEMICLPSVDIELFSKPESTRYIKDMEAVSEYGVTATFCEQTQRGMNHRTCRVCWYLQEWVATSNWGPLEGEGIETESYRRTSATKSWHELTPPPPPRWDNAKYALRFYVGTQLW
jgi:hypothetical protein